MSRLVAVALAAAVSGRVSGAAAAEIAVVAERGAELDALTAGLRSAAGEGGRVSVHRLPAGDSIDPIQRGRLIAQVQAADLIVTLGDRATEFMLAEREKTPVFFVGAASLVRGAWLASPDVAGILPYNIDASLDLVQALGLAPLGLACTSGYGRVADRIEAGARARGLAVIRRVIGERKAVGPAVRDLVRDARCVWVLGDPLLTRGAGFDFVVEQCLAGGVPVVAPQRREVEGGATLAYESGRAALAAAAVERVAGRFGSDAPPEGDRIGSAPPAGTFLVNRVLGAKLLPAIPAGTGWKAVP